MHALILFIVGKLEHLEMAKFSVESIEQVALRFLRARQFDNAKSAVLLEDCINLMIEGKAAECAAASPNTNAQCDVDIMKNWYPHTCYGFDKLARPILWEHSGGTNPNVPTRFFTHSQRSYSLTFSIIR